MGDHWRRLDRIPLTYSSLKWLQSVPGYSKLPWHEVVCVYSLLPVFLSLPTLHWSPSDTYILSLFLPFQSSPHYFFKTLWHTTLPPPPPRPPTPTALPPRNFPLSDFRLIFLSRHSRWLPSDSLCWYVVCGEISWRLVSASLTEQIQTLTDGSVAKTAKTNGPTRIKQIAPAKPRGRAG